MKLGSDVLRVISKIAVGAALLPLRLFPIKSNRVMLINSLSFQYSDNPRAIGEYLRKHFPGKFELIVTVKDLKNAGPLKEQGIKAVKYLGIAYFFYALTAKVFITNSGGYSFLPIHKQQVVINTWHGGGAYKKGGLDVCKHTPAYLKDVALMSRKTSLFLTTCTAQTEIFERAYQLDREKILEIGMPRNDIFFSDYEERKARIKESLGLDPSEKIVLYAPTFRIEDDNQFGNMIAGSYGIDTKMVCGALAKRFGGRWRFAYRLHPLIQGRSLEQFKDAVNLSNYADMQDLLLISDVLINDYSSSMWDFAFTKRPCFIFATDIDQYSQTTSWYTPIEEWPYPLARSNKALQEKIHEFDAEQYAQDVSRHLALLGCCEDGKATEKICRRIEEICFFQKRRGHADKEN